MTKIVTSGTKTKSVKNSTNTETETKGTNNETVTNGTKNETVTKWYKDWNSNQWYKDWSSNQWYKDWSSNQMVQTLKRLQISSEGTSGVCGRSLTLALMCFLSIFDSRLWTSPPTGKCVRIGTFIDKRWICLKYLVAMKARLLASDHCVPDMTRILQNTQDGDVVLRKTFWNQWPFGKVVIVSQRWSIDES